MNLNEQWKEYIKLDSYAHPVEFLEEYLEYTPVQSKLIGTWRWGNINEDIYQAPDNSLIGVTYRDASGDGDIDANGMDADFYTVEAKEVTVVEYVKVVK